MSILKTHGETASRLAEELDDFGSGTNAEFQGEEWISPGDYRQKITGGKGISRHRYDRFVDRVKDAAGGLGIISVPDTNGHPAYPTSVVARAWGDVMFGFRDRVSNYLRQMTKLDPGPFDRKTCWDALIATKNPLWLALDRGTKEEVREQAVYVAAVLQKLVEDSESWEK